MTDFKRYLPSDTSLPSMHLALGRLWDALEAQRGVTAAPPVRVQPLGSSPTFSAASGSTGTASRHNTLPGLQGGDTDNYYHLKLDEYTGTGTGIFVRQDSPTINGTATFYQIVAGEWLGTKIGLAYGGTNADLSATGGTAQVLRQSTLGGAVTVGQLAGSEITNTPAGNIAATDVQAALNELDTEKVPTTRAISTAAPLTGGGDMSADRTLAISAATTAAAGSMSAADKAKLDALYIQAPPSVTKDSTGFSDPTAVTQSYDSAARTVTLSGAFTAYWQGNLVPELVGGWASPAHDTTPGPHFLYYDGATFAWYPAPWTFDMLQIAYVYYGASDKFGIRECHGLMPWQVHEELHRTIGTYYEIGGDLGGYTLASTVAADRRPSVSATTVHDEDITSVITALADNGPYTQMWMAGSTNTFLTGAADIVPLLVAQPYWNSAGTQVLMTNNSYMTIWLVAAPVMSSAGSQLYRYIWVQGQSEGTLGAQQALAFNTLSLGTLATVFTEFVPIGRVVIRYTAGNWSIAQVDKISGTRVSSTLVSGGGLTSVTANPPLSGSGTVADPLTIPAATASVNGYATSTQIAKLDGIAAGATANLGTVTSVAALTLGTTGTDLSSTVANGTTTPAITLNVPTASATNRGALSAADWNAFNGKQAALGYTPINKAGDTGIGALSMGALTATSGIFYKPTSVSIVSDGIQVHRPGSLGQYAFMSYAFGSSRAYFGSVYTGLGAGTYGQIILRQYDSVGGRDILTIGTNGNSTFGAYAVSMGALTATTAGFNGKTPQASYAVNAACTDLATAVALINQLRAALVANGICV